MRTVTGGEGGIRTHGDVAATPVFKTGAFNHSATSPYPDLRGKPAVRKQSLAVVLTKPAKSCQNRAFL